MTTRTVVQFVIVVDLALIRVSCHASVPRAFCYITLTVRHELPKSLCDLDIRRTLYRRFLYILVRF